MPWYETILEHFVTLHPRLPCHIFDMKSTRNTICDVKRSDKTFNKHSCPTTIICLFLCKSYSTSFCVSCRITFVMSQLLKQPLSIWITSRVKSNTGCTSTIEHIWTSVNAITRNIKQISLALTAVINSNFYNWNQTPLQLFSFNDRFRTNITDILY